MGKILKVTVQEQNWNKITEKYETVIKEYDRETYKFDFEDLLLENIEDNNIEYYAENSLNMVEEDNCKCDIDDFKEHEIISYLEEEGYEVLKCNSIVDKMRLDKLKEAFQL